MNRGFQEREIINAAVGRVDKDREAFPTPIPLSALVSADNEPSSTSESTMEGYSNCEGDGEEPWIEEVGLSLLVSPLNQSSVPCLFRGEAIMEHVNRYRQGGEKAGFSNPRRVR